MVRVSQVRRSSIDSAKFSGTQQENAKEPLPVSWRRFCHLQLQSMTQEAVQPDLAGGVQSVFASAIHDVFLLGMLLIIVALAAGMLIGDARLIKKEPYSRQSRVSQ